MNKVDVSIVLSVYNGEKTIVKMLDSILNQTFIDWELIVVNDGSTDSTRSIIESFIQKDNRIRIVNKKNEGLGSARISGMEISRGAYIINVDADDWMEPDYVELLYKTIIDKRVDIVWCDIYDNEETNHVWRFNNGLDKDLLIKQMLLHTIWSPQWNRIIKRETAIKNMRFLEGLQQWEDMVFNVACLLDDTKISYLSRPLYHYTVNNPESLCNSVNKRCVIPEYKKAISNLNKVFDYYSCSKYEYHFNYNKLYAIRDYIDDKRFVDYDSFLNTYPEAIQHIWEYSNYPMRLKICAWLIKKNMPQLVPIECKIDAFFRKMGISKQA